MKAFRLPFADELFPAAKDVPAVTSFEISDDFCPWDRLVAAFTWPARATSWSWTPNTVTVNDCGVASLPAASCALQVTVVVFELRFAPSGNTEPDAGEQVIVIADDGSSGSVAVTV